MRSKVIVMAVTLAAALGATLVAFHLIGWDVTDPSQTVILAQNKTGAVRTPAARPGGAGVERKDFGSWMLLCPAEGKAPCTVGQQLTRKADNKLVIGLSLSPAAGGASTLIVHTPLEVLLTPGTMLAIDGGAPVRLPFTKCRPTQCQASASVDQKVVEKLAAAQKIVVSFRLASGQPVNVDLGMEGLGNALAAEGETGQDSLIPL
jgi:invasion protein IalB